MSDHRLLCLVPLCLLLGTLLAGGAAARTWRVERDGSGDSVTIQPAVNAAAPGDTIWIGNGRYREYETSLAWGAPARDVYVLVGTDDLTFIGEDPDSVKIGPDEYVYENYGPIGMGILSSVATIAVRDLGFLNHYFGIKQSEGQSAIRGCLFRGGGCGIAWWEGTGKTAQDNRFVGCDDGILAYYCREVDISDCHFRDCGNDGAALHFEGSHFIEARDCVIEDGRRGIAFDHASGVLNRCDVTGPEFDAIVVAASTVVITDCKLDGVMAGLWGYNAAHVTAERTRFRAQTYASIAMAMSTAMLRNCTIANGGAPSVVLDDRYYDPAGPYDLRENWWGVADSTRIADWIIDVNDDPEIGAEVQFMPFLDHQVSVERKTLGGLKALFR